MINICKPNGKLAKSFKNDDSFNHLSGGELLKDHHEIGATQWGFVVFPPKKVPDLYLNLKQKPIPARLKEAYEQQLGVIEICKGDYANPTWVPITFDLDIGQLKKDWYLECCKKHGFFVIEE
jgi:hypothetical protein